MRIAFSEICKGTAAAKRSAAKPEKPRAIPDASAPAAEVLQAWEELGAVMGRIDTSSVMTERELAGFKRLLALKGELLSILLDKYGAGEGTEQERGQVYHHFL